MPEYEIIYRKTIRVGYKVVAESEEEAATTDELDCGEADWVETIDRELEDIRGSD